MADKTEAERLADALDAHEPNFYGESSLWFDSKLSDYVTQAADELRRLSAVERDLRAEVARLGADAGRYQWLTGTHDRAVFLLKRYPPQAGWIDAKEAINAAIDAAMKGEAR